MAQCPFTDCLASAMALGPLASLKVLPWSLALRVHPAPPSTCDDPDCSAWPLAPDERGGRLPGYQALPAKNSTFRTPGRCRVAPTICGIGREAGPIKSRGSNPVSISDTDSVTPPEETERYARTAPRG